MVESFNPRNDQSPGTNYGWVRIDVAANSSSFTLIEYAYQDDGTPIVTGDKGPLPIELTSFDARTFAKGVELLWSTSREENFDGFSLERAEGDGIFSEIAWKSGTGGTEQEEYAYRDETAIENKQYYYRLKSVDIDGSFAYTKIVEITVNNSGFDIGEIFPNPVTDQIIRLNITATEPETVNLLLFSSVGQLVHEERKPMAIGTNSIEISFPELTPGAYFLKVQGKYHNGYKQLIIR